MDTSRLTAYKTLLRFESHQEKPDSIIERFTVGSEISTRDRAFISEIVYGVLRWRRGLDLIIESQSKRPISKIDTPVLALLRMGLYQAFGMSKTPQSAAVNETVKIAKSNNKTRHASGFINAVIRGAIRSTCKSGDKPPSISKIACSMVKGNNRAPLGAQYSFPDWIVQRWINNFGTETAEKIMDESNQRAPVFIRVNRLKINTNDFETALAESSLEAERVGWSDDLYILTKGTLHLGSELITNGYCRAQDGASYISASLLAPASDETIADICCGKGIKTALFAEQMKNSGTIFCVDTSYNSLTELNNNLHNLEVKIHYPTLADATGVWPVNQRFDKIFIDAPCSGTGVLRRRPDGKWTKSEETIKRMAKLQIAILQRAVGYLADGGELVYAVCSIEPEEGKTQVDRLLEEHSSLARADIAKDQPEFTQFINEDGDFFNLPGNGKMDGFYAAKLVKAD